LKGVLVQGRKKGWFNIFRISWGGRDDHGRDFRFRGGGGENWGGKVLLRGEGNYLGDRKEEKRAKSQRVRWLQENKTNQKFLRK